MMYLHTESTFRCDVHFIYWWWCTLWSADGDFTQCETCHKFIIKLCGSVFQCSSCSVYFHRNTYWHYPYYPIGGQVHNIYHINGEWILYTRGARVFIPGSVGNQLWYAIPGMQGCIYVLTWILGILGSWMLKYTKVAVYCFCMGI